MKTESKLLVLAVSMLIPSSVYATGGGAQADPDLFNALIQQAPKQDRNLEAKVFVDTFNRLNSAPRHWVMPPMQFEKTQTDSSGTEFHGHLEGVIFNPAPECQSFTLDIEGEVLGADTKQPVYIINTVSTQFSEPEGCV